MNIIYFKSVLFLLGSLSFSEIIPYRRDIIFPQRPSYLSIPKFNADDAPNWSPGHGQSFIVTQPMISSDRPIQNSYHPSSVCANSTVELLVFESPSEGDHWMTYWNEDSFCCTEQAISKNKCGSDKLNSLIIPHQFAGVYDKTLPIVYGKVATLTDMPMSHMTIKKTGVYVIFIAICDPKASPVALDGPLEIMNPYGYLPADLFGNLPFFGAISCAYLVVSLVWVAFLFFHSGEILPLQMWITSVLGLGLIETTLLFAHYLDWNDAGIPSTAITMIGLVFGVSKRAVSRAVVLMVALGYGVVRPALGEDLKKVLYLTAAYYILSVVFTLASNVPAKSQIVGDPEFSDLLSLVVFMLAMVDTTFYVWTLQSLNSLMTSLKSRQQTVKWVLYARFRFILFFSLMFSCIWAFYSMITYYGDKFEKNWKHRWTTDALYEISYFIILVSIAILWAPSRNSQRYAYSVELTQVDHDDEDDPNRSLEGNHLEGFTDTDLDAEYGGRMNNDDENPFLGTGALDTAMAFMKKA